MKNILTTLVGIFYGAICALAGTPPLRIPLNDPLYKVTDVYPFGPDFFILDLQNHALVRIDRKGSVLAKRTGKGQGPGDFFMPRCVAANQKNVFVGDLNKIHVFDTDLNFVRAFSTFNNPQDFLLHGDTLIASMVEYPLGPHAIYSMEFNGKVINHFFEHGVSDQLAEPFIVMDKTGQIFAQPRTRFGLIHTEPGEKDEVLPLPKPIYYQDYTDPTKFFIKHGNNRSAALNWKSQWTEGCGLALVDDRFFVLCYTKLQSDLLTRDYYFTIYDSKEKKVIGKTNKAPGPLVCGGDAAYFVETQDNMKEDTTDMFLVGHLISDFQ